MTSHAVPELTFGFLTTSPAPYWGPAVVARVSAGWAVSFAGVIFTHPAMNVHKMRRIHRPERMERVPYILIIDHGSFLKKPIPNKADIP
jgi:hypothetical protein